MCDFNMFTDNQLFWLTVALPCALTLIMLDNTIPTSPSLQDSAKGGAVETGCCGSHYIIGCFII